MPRFAANISTLYPEHALLDRVAAAARDGFAAVEVQSPYAVAAAALRDALREARVELVLMNAPQGDMDAGERGLAAMPGRESEFRRSIDQAADFARAVAARRVHVMAGKPPAGSDPAEAEAVFIRNLRYACEVFAAHGIRALIEPINTRDMPGYFLTTPEQAAAIIPKVGAANLAMQFDIYHAQIMVGDVSKRLERHLPLVGHVQIAGVPERHEPDTGEINYPALFRLLDRLGYTGWIGCEYRPARGTTAGGTSAGLGWLRRC
ncbi:MAG: 2-oxo-tetronate isomerase [Burkholderiaceae bacterium]